MEYTYDQRSASFTWHDASPPFRRVSNAQARAFNEVGGFVLADAFSAEELAPLIAELDELEAQATAYVRSQPPPQHTIARADDIMFRPHAVTQSACAQAFSRHPVFADLARDLLGDSVRLYWDQLVYKKPDTVDEFPWHQDNGYTFVEPQQYLTCWVALTDADQRNGCPWIVPGLHRGGTLRHRWTELGFECLRDVVDAQPMPLRAGSVAVFSSLTPHRTGPNTTNAVRKAYILQYAPDGAVVHPHDGDPQPANAPERQYFV